MNIKELREMISLMKEHDLIELEVEKEGERIRLKKDAGGVIAREQDTHARYMPSQPVSPPAELPAAARPEIVDDKAYLVRSPMVGTFYSAPAPDQDSYVTKGGSVKEGDVLCIIEAMKLMNEIKSEVNGKILEILVGNGQPVEFDQPLFKIEKP